MKTIILSIFITVFLAISSFGQVTSTNKLHPFSGKWVVSVEGGATYTRSDFRNSLFDYYARIMGEYFFPTTNTGIFGIRVFSGTGFIGGDGGVSVTLPQYSAFRSNIVLLGAGADFVLAASDVVFPYVYAGGSYLNFDPKNSGGTRLPNNRGKVYSRHEYSIQGELGVRFLLSENFSFNLNGDINYVDNDRLDDVQIGSDNDIFFTFMGGFSFYFGGTPDSDGDGIEDSYDACPDTPHGVHVDEFGCPVDTDRDGIPDYLDRCQGTPSNIVVNEFGCPIDTDEDGVPDFKDQCPNTPANVPVDARGCPFDEDADGVPDYIDNCPGTPAGTEVNKFGCQLESQKKELPEITNFSLSGEVNFQTGRSTLLRGAQVQLDKFIDVLKKYPDTNWRIEGHTDNTGSRSTNDKLSYRRAKAVADYLTRHSIDPSRFVVKGYGPDYPIGDNSTPSGRAMNRRVTIEMLTGSGGEVTSGPRKVDENAEYNTAIERNVGSMIFTDGNLYCFQLSSWRSQHKALSEVERLQAEGENAFVVEAKNIPNLQGTWYRVRIGYFKSLEAARKNKARIH